MPELLQMLFDFLLMSFAIAVFFWVGWTLGENTEAKKHGFRDLDGRYHCTDCQKVEKVNA